MIIKTKAGRYPRYRVLSGLEVLGELCVLGFVWQVVWFVISIIKHF